MKPKLRTTARRQQVHGLSNIAILLTGYDEIVIAPLPNCARAASRWERGQSRGRRGADGPPEGSTLSLNLSQFVARQNWLKSCDSSQYVSANLVKRGELPRGLHLFMSTNFDQLQTLIN